MTIEQLTEILNHLGFVNQGKLIAPNFRVVFNYAGLRIVVTRNDGEIFHTNNREWTFSLKRIKTEDLFKMLDYYFDEDEESIYSPKITVNKDESYESFRTRTIREEKLKELSI
jgi:hypothetical protein